MSSVILLALGWTCFGGAALLVVLGELYRRRARQTLDRLGEELADCHATIADQHRLICSMARALHAVKDGPRAAN